LLASLQNIQPADTGGYCRRQFDLQPTIGSGSRAVMAIVDLEDPGDLRPGATLEKYCW
jgi:hypothetical protein